jgi:hypothetical protein
MVEVDRITRGAVDKLGKYARQKWSALGPGAILCRPL